MKISFIGYGNIAQAIAQNLAKNSNYQLYAAAPSLPMGINDLGIVTEQDNLAILHDADCIILAVKPFTMAQVLQQIYSAIPSDCIVISLAAGLNLTWLAQHCPENQTIIRAMPNIAVSVGEGVTAVCANQKLTKHQQSVVTQLFQCMGIVTWVTAEAELEIFTSLFGSGPAYVFLFIESMLQAALKLGLTKDLAQTCILQTMLGAVELVRNTQLDIKLLREKVTSTGGTTAAALQVLQAEGFEQLLFKAIEAAVARAKEIGANNI